MDNNSFFSIDKLIEFGLGLGVAQQMITMMNQSMKSMYVPGSYMALPQENMMIYIANGQNPEGPFSASQFREMIVKKQISKETLAWMPGMAVWDPIEKIPALLKIIAIVPPPVL